MKNTTERAIGKLVCHNDGCHRVSELDEDYDGPSIRFDSTSDKSLIGSMMRLLGEFYQVLQSDVIKDPNKFK